MVIKHKFRFYLIFCDFIILLKCLILYHLVMMLCFHHLVTAFYLYANDLNKYNIFDQIKIRDHIIVISMLHI